MYREDQKSKPLAKQKRYIWLIFSLTLCFWLTTLIVRTNGYVPKISSSKTMWAAGHFTQYTILGYLAPDCVIVSWLIGVGFELFEYIGQIRGWPFLIGKATDPLINAAGLYCGYRAQWMCG